MDSYRPQNNWHTTSKKPFLRVNKEPHRQNYGLGKVRNAIDSIKEQQKLKQDFDYL